LYQCCKHYLYLDKAFSSNIIDESVSNHFVSLFDRKDVVGIFFHSFNAFIACSKSFFILLFDIHVSLTTLQNCSAIIQVGISLIANFAISFNGIHFKVFGIDFIVSTTFLGKYCNAFHAL